MRQLPSRESCFAKSANSHRKSHHLILWVVAPALFFINQYTCLYCLISCNSSATKSLSHKEEACLQQAGKNLFGFLVNFNVPLINWIVQSSSDLLKLLKPQIMHRHSRESGNPDYYQYHMTCGCRIKSGMTREL